jgi:putative effector of murein hydrolase
MVPTTSLVNLVLLSILAYHQFHMATWDFWLQVPYFIFAFALFRQARRLKRRVAELVGAVAQRCKLTRVKK